MRLKPVEQSTRPNWLILGVMSALVALAIVYHQPLVTQFRLNLAWVQLVENLLASSEGAQAFDSGYLANFEDALARYPQGSRVAFALGTGKKLSGDAAGALAVWTREQVDPQLLINIGDWHLARMEREQALDYYRFATQLVHDVEGSARAQYKIDYLCQQTLWSGEVLPAPVVDACRGWSSPSTNLLVDGDFAEGTLTFWSRRNVGDVKYDLVPDEAADSTLADGSTRDAGDLLLKVTSENADNYAGVLQVLTVPPQTVVHLRARIKVETEEQVVLYPLYLRIDRDDGYWRASGSEIHAAIDWIDVEGRFEIPATGEQVVQIYPVFFRGRATVWVDHVELFVTEPSAAEPQ